MSTFIDLGAGGSPFEATYIFGRGKWVITTTDPTSGAITLGTPFARTPWYTQTDCNLQHAIKANKNNEAQVLSFRRHLHQPAQSVLCHLLLGGIQLELVRFGVASRWIEHHKRCAVLPGR